MDLFGPRLEYQFPQHCLGYADYSTVIIREVLKSRNSLWSSSPLRASPEFGAHLHALCSSQDTKLYFVYACSWRPDKPCSSKENAGGGDTWTWIRIQALTSCVIFGERQPP